MFTRQHYEAIAEIMKINSTKEVCATRLVILDIAEELANYFAQDNPRFDRQKFLEACVANGEL